jgi:hypothetical protein
MSKEEAYKRYLEGGFDNIMPFKSKFEFDYIKLLEEEGIEVEEESSIHNTDRK